VFFKFIILGSIATVVLNAQVCLNRMTDMNHLNPLLLKQIAMGCGMAAPHIRVNFAGSDDYNFTPDKLHILGRIEDHCRNKKTSVAAVIFRNLGHEQILQGLTALAKQDTCEEIRFDQCDASDIATVLAELKENAVLSNVKTLYLEHTPLKLKELTEIVSYFPKLNGLELTQVKLDFPVQEPDEISAFSSVQTLLISPALNTGDVLRPYTGRVFAKVFPNLIKVSMSQFQTQHFETATVFLRTMFSQMDTSVRETLEIAIGRQDFRKASLFLSTTNGVSEKLREVLNPEYTASEC
jgi:hypothetical protein